MKNLYISLCAVLALAGCAGGIPLSDLADPIVRVAETVTEQNTSTARGATAGMNSNDAATVLINRAYYDAAEKIYAPSEKKGSLLLVEMESHDGKPITIDAKKFRVYAPPQNPGNNGPINLAQPKEIESSGIKWFREGKETLRDVFLPWSRNERYYEYQRQTNTNNTTIRRDELGIVSDSVQGSRDLADTAINKDPFVVPAPAPAPTPAPTPVAP